MMELGPTLARSAAQVAQTSAPLAISQPRPPGSSFTLVYRIACHATHARLCVRDNYGAGTQAPPASRGAERER